MYGVPGISGISCMVSPEFPGISRDIRPINFTFSHPNDLPQCYVFSKRPAEHVQVVGRGK